MANYLQIILITIFNQKYIYKHQLYLGIRMPNFWPLQTNQ